MRSTWGTSLGEDKLGATDKMLNTKVAHRACPPVRPKYTAPRPDAGKRPCCVPNWRPLERGMQQSPLGAPRKSKVRRSDRLLSRFEDFNRGDPARVYFAGIPPPLRNEYSMHGTSLPWKVTAKHCKNMGEYQTRCARGACAVRVLGLFRGPFHPEPIGGMVTPQSPAGTIYNSLPRRPYPGEVVQIPDAVRARCGYSPYGPGMGPVLSWTLSSTEH